MTKSELERWRGFSKWISETEARFTCPAPGHDDEHPSCDVNIEKKTFLCRSSACGEKGTLKRFADLVGVDYHSEKSSEPEYFYYHGSGSVAYKKIRRVKGGQKEFYFLHPVGDEWKRGRGGGSLLYRLPQVKKGIDEDKPIFVTEGERDADSIANFGYVATTNDAGAGKWKDEHSKHFTEGVNVFIVGDNDDAGRVHVQTVADALLRRKCIVRVVVIPEGKDVSDWIAKGATKDDFNKLVLDSPEWKKAKLPPLSTGNDLKNKEFPPPQWIIKDILPEDGLTILAGKPKIGKSWLALQLASALSCGGKMFGEIGVRNVGVLLLALEDTERRLKSRMETLQSSFTKNFYYATKWPQGEDARNKLRDYLEAYEDIKVVIIDTLFRVRGPSGNNNQYQVDYEECNRLKEIADDMGVSIIALHHTNKRLSNDPLEMINGTNGLSGSADTLLVLTRTRGEMDAELYVEGRDVEQKEIALNLDIESGVGWVYQGEAQEFRENELDRKIINIMKEEEGEAHLGDLVKEIGVEYVNIQNAMRRLMRLGEVRRKRRGVYVLTQLDY